LHAQRRELAEAARVGVLRVLAELSFDRVEVDGRLRRDNVAAALGEEVAADVLQAARDERLGELFADEVGDDAFPSDELSVAQQIAGAISIEAAGRRGDDFVAVEFEESVRRELGAPASRRLARRRLGAA